MIEIAGTRSGRSMCDYELEDTLAKAYASMESRRMRPKEFPGRKLRELDERASKIADAVFDSLIDNITALLFGKGV